MSLPVAWECLSSPAQRARVKALLLGAGHALVDADVVVEGFGGVAFGRVAPFQAHPDVGWLRGAPSRRR